MGSVMVDLVIFRQERTIVISNVLKTNISFHISVIMIQLTRMVTELNRNIAVYGMMNFS